MFEAPICSRMESGSGACLVPENIMCSNRWANPLRPGVWLAAPTWYPTFTETCGRRWSSLRMTASPLGSRYFSNLSSGSLARAGSAQSAAAKTRTRRSKRGLLPEGTALVLPTPPRRKLVSHVRAAAPSTRDRPESHPKDCTTEDTERTEMNFEKYLRVLRDLRGARF